MLLSSILITSDDGPRPELSRALQENIESFKRAFPRLPHRLFVQAEAVELIRDKFPKEVLDAYFALVPYAYRADLARYCILHEFGGVYADLAYFFVGTVPTPIDRAVVFRGNLVSSPWDTSNGIIYMPPKHKAMVRAIELLCENVKRRYHGLTALCPTGPVVFGKALAETCEAEELITGWATLLEREKLRKLVPELPLPRGDRIHCQILKERLIAVKRKSIKAGGLGPFGIKSGNYYRDLWHRQEIYA